MEYRKILNHFVDRAEHERRSYLVLILRRVEEEELIVFEHNLFRTILDYY